MRPATAELNDVLDRLAVDGGRHLTGGPVSEDELQMLEGIVGSPLPASFRALLARLGSGLFYQGHEIFGPLRVMVHDIELVPSLGAVLARLRAESLEPGLLPFHRSEGHLHCFDGRDLRQPERIVSIPGGSEYRDLPSFLRAVVVP